MLNNTLTPEWLTCTEKKENPQFRLFFFPYGGGGTSLFRTWGDTLPLEIEIYLVRLPGREDRSIEPPFDQIKPLISQLTQAFIPYLDQPYAFFGHSMGALISFELTRELRRRKLPLPLHLFLSSRPAPHISNWHKSVHQLSDKELIREVSQQNGLPGEALHNQKLLRLFLPVLRADFALCESYIYTKEPPLNCAISVFGGIEDTYVGYKDLIAWRIHTDRAFTIRMFPGDHFFLHNAQKLLTQTMCKDITPLLNT